MLDSVAGAWEQQASSLPARLTMPHPNYPILVGLGQITHRIADVSEALEPVELMAEAARRAERDAGASALLGRVDSVRVVNLVSWSYGDAPGALASRLGIAPRERIYTTLGGNTPQFLINETADEIARGRVRLALVAGAEAMYSQRLARAARVRLRWTPPCGEPDRVLGDARWGTQDLEARHGAAMPIHIYPLFENAWRAAHGWTIAEHRARLAKLCARFAEIAAANPFSWFRERRTAEEIGTVTAENRMISFPYPKFMNSVLDVNQGAAVLMTSAGAARELGIPEERWIYLRGAADAHDHWWILDRVDFASSPAIRRAGAAALEQAEASIGDVAFLDLYSCFPVAPQIARAMLGIADGDPRDLTVTGSLLYFGGPGSNHPLHAVVCMADRLRRERSALGLVTGLGWYLTKHSVGVYSTRPAAGAWARRDAGVQAAIDAEPHPAVAPEPSGSGRVEAYTVVHDREGAPQRGIVVGRLDGGRRFIANTPPDRALLEEMEAREFVGARGRVSADGPEATNVWRPA